MKYMKYLRISISAQNVSKPFKLTPHLHLN